MLQPNFVLDPRLAAESLGVGDLELSRVLLLNDSRFPWLILVPRRADCREIIDLPAPDRATLMHEIVLCSTALKRLTDADKQALIDSARTARMVRGKLMAVLREAEGSLSSARFDAAWPEPVWGRGMPTPYPADTGRSRAAAIWSALGFM